MIHPHIHLCMPDGPMGAIIKPMEWRRHNSSKLDLFARDWLEFIRPLKIRRRILMSYRQIRVEKYKDDMRHWWFSLSKYEQGRLFSIRKDTGQKIISHFNGPKYQRGNFAMFPAGTTAVANSGEVLSLDAANNSALNIDFTPANALYASFQLQRTGFLARDNSGNTSAGRSLVDINTGTDWVTPRDSTVGDAYEVKWNLTAGNAADVNDEDFTEDVWSQLNTNRRVSMTRIIVSISESFEFDIGDNGTSTSDINQNYTIESGEII